MQHNFDVKFIYNVTNIVILNEKFLNNTLKIIIWD